MKFQRQSLKKSLERYIYIYLRTCRTQSAKDEGYVLFLVMSIMFILQALLMGYVILARIDKGTTVAASNTSQGFYNAEAGLNRRAEDIRAKFQDYGQPVGTSPAGISESARRKACLDSDNTKHGSGDFSCKEYKFSTGVDKEPRATKTYISSDNNGQGTLVRIPSGQAFAGLNAQEYSYKIAAASYSGSAMKSSGEVEKNANPESILELRVKNRLVPLFQFAAFYKDDLEINPGATMTLNGPVHTNKDLFLSSSATLTVKGQITSVGNLFNRRKDTNATSSYNTVRVFDGSIDRALLDANNGNTTTGALNVAKLKSLWNKRILPGIDEVQLPRISVLSKSGDYYKNADLRIEFKPKDNTTSNPLQMAVSAVNRTGGTPTTTDLSEGQLRSLRNPVLTSLKCPATSEPTSSAYNVAKTWTTVQKQVIARALQTYIASNNTFFKVSELPSTTQLSTLPSGGITPASGATSLQQLIVTNPQLSTSLWNDTIKNLTVNEVAYLVGKCFKAAPLSIADFANYREDRTIKLLQINVESLTAWNKDGVYVEFSAGNVTNDNSKNGFSAEGILFNIAAADANAVNGSFQKLGYAASDTSHGGLVVYASVDDGASTEAESDESPYGFALVDGRELPGLATTTTYLDPTGMTFGTNQAIYIQGDYNNVNKQPAGILADSLNVLSNNCLNTTDRSINCGRGRNVTKLFATNTTINSAFLAGVDETESSKYNGGLENYPRLHEQWSTNGNRTLTYRGSFVSLSNPLHVSGSWMNTGTTTYQAPIRNWDYDTDFNEFKNLPPMTPNLVYLWQDKFGRVLEQ